jgi:hypothetical protein
MAEDAGAAARELVIDLDGLCWALNSRDPLWFAFERAAMAAIARRWCEDHGIAPRWQRPGSPAT